jgi:uncharacterized protein RhaS with RHS repeats
VTPTYDANGNLISTESGSYAYDAENRLAHGPGNAELAYDTIGRLFFTYSDYAERLLSQHLHCGDSVLDQQSPRRGSG